MGIASLLAKDGLSPVFFRAICRATSGRVIHAPLCLMRLVVSIVMRHDQHRAQISTEWLELPAAMFGCDIQSVTASPSEKTHGWAAASAGASQPAT
jgi:hypothetical protein